MSYNIGTYYFPGWLLQNGGGAYPSYPWNGIPDERLPIRGKYDESLQEISDETLTQCRDFGINWIAYDWYCNFSSKTISIELEHAINNHKTSSVTNKPKYCLNWCFQTNSSQFSVNNFSDVYSYWISKYFSDDNYLTINGCPVVIIFDLPTMTNRFGGNSAVSSALSAARNAAITAGYNGIYFVASLSTVSSYWKSAFKSQGWNAITAYTVSKKTQRWGDSTYTSKSGFEQLDDAMFGDMESYGSSYYISWSDKTYAWGAVNTDVILPLSAGFNAEPWGVSGTTEMATNDEFKSHLLKGKTWLDSKGNTFAVIDAWNEFGEGSIVQPCKKYGYGRLKSIRDVFSS